MRSFLFLLLLIVPAFAGNSVIITSTGNTQNVTVTQTGGDHTATVSVNGTNPTVVVTQTGTTNQSVSVDINCGTTCPTSPYTVNQP
jgi:Curlin associated repeat